MMKIISDHNKKVLGKRQTRAGSGCNCEDGVESCPFEGDCLSKNQIYKATVSSIQGRKEYIGQTANSFKERYGNHKNSFVKAYKRKSTALSTYIWSLNVKALIMTSNGLPYVKHCRIKVEVDFVIFVLPRKPLSLEAIQIKRSTKEVKSWQNVDTNCHFI